MSYAAKILADSVSPEACRLTTFEITFPRFVLAEFNTHRMLSRNSASSRAIPVEKRIAMVEADPFVPEAFGKNQKGMQAGAALDEGEASHARAIWLAAASHAVTQARGLAGLGVHKQLANRLLEPFLWHTVIVTATEWSNFFALRCHKDAQPEIRKIAEWMRSLHEEGTPQLVDFGDEHLPMIDADEALEEIHCSEVALVSIGRCARVSYLTHDGRRDPKEDVALAKRLAASGHLSPFEHAARAVRRSDPNPSSNFVGWRQRRKDIRFEADFGLATRERDRS